MMLGSRGGAENKDCLPMQEVFMYKSRMSNGPIAPELTGTLCRSLIE